jgi:hypothetical protein
MLEQILPKDIYKQLEERKLIADIEAYIAQEKKSMTVQDKLDESYKTYKPDIRVMTEDNSFRRTVTDKLPVSKRKFTMVEPNCEGREYTTQNELLADLLISVERHKDDPKAKTEPVIDFTSEKYAADPSIKIHFIESLGQGEAAMLHYVVGYLRYLTDEFFRTGK